MFCTRFSEHRTFVGRNNVFSWFPGFLIFLMNRNHFGMRVLSGYSTSRREEKERMLMLPTKVPFWGNHPQKLECFALVFRNIGLLSGATMFFPGFLVSSFF